MKSKRLTFHAAVCVPSAEPLPMGSFRPCRIALPPVTARPPAAKAGGPSLPCTIATEGAPSLRFLQGWAAMLRAQLVRSTLPVVDAVVVPAPSTGSGQALRKVREGRGTGPVVASAVWKPVHLPRPPLGFRNGPALRYVQISRMTIVKTPTSYFACASFVTTAATLSSIWFQPSI